MPETDEDKHNAMLYAFTRNGIGELPKPPVTDDTARLESKIGPISGIEVPANITDDTLTHQEIASQANPNPEIDDINILAKNAYEYHEQYLNQKRLEHLKRERRDKASKRGRGVISRLFRRG